MPKTDSSPPTAQQVASAFRLTGWISFWTQVVLGVVSSIVLLLAAFSTRATPNTANNPSTGFGLFLTVCGLLVLYFSIYWAFSYVRLSRQLLAKDTKVRPKKAETIKQLRMGLMINLAGMIFTLLGSQATVGGLVTKSLVQGLGTFIDPSRTIQPLDLFVVQANTNIITAQFVAIAASLWLLNKIIR